MSSSFVHSLQHSRTSLSLVQSCQPKLMCRKNCTSTKKNQKNALSFQLSCVSPASNLQFFQPNPLYSLACTCSLSSICRLTQSIIFGHTDHTGCPSFCTQKEKTEKLLPPFCKSFSPLLIRVSQASNPSFSFFHPLAILGVGNTFSLYVFYEARTC